MTYFRDRLREPGTWRALALAGVALGLWGEAQAVMAASALAGLVAALLPEGGR